MINHYIVYYNIKRGLTFLVSPFRGKTPEGKDKKKQKGKREEGENQ